MSQTGFHESNEPRPGRKAGPSRTGDASAKRKGSNGAEAHGATRGTSAPTKKAGGAPPSQPKRWRPRSGDGGPGVSRDEAEALDSAEERRVDHSQQLRWYDEATKEGAERASNLRRAQERVRNYMATRDRDGGARKRARGWEGVDDDRGDAWNGGSGGSGDEAWDGHHEGAASRRQRPKRARTSGASRGSAEDREGIANPGGRGGRVRSDDGHEGEEEGGGEEEEEEEEERGEEDEATYALRTGRGRYGTQVRTRTRRRGNGRSKAPPVARRTGGGGGGGGGGGEEDEGIGTPAEDLDGNAPTGDEDDVDMGYPQGDRLTRSRPAPRSGRSDLFLDCRGNEVPVRDAYGPTGDAEASARLDQWSPSGTQRRGRRASSQNARGQAVAHQRQDQQQRPRGGPPVPGEARESRFGDVDGDAYTPEQLRDALMDMYEEWRPPPETSLHLEWANRQFGLVADAYTSLEAIYERRREKLDEAVSLYMRCSLEKVVGNHSEEAMELTHMYSGVMESIAYAYHMVDSHRRMVNAYLPPGERDAYVPPEVTAFRFTLRHTGDETPAQSLIKYLLQRLSHLGYRRKGDMCYRQIMVTLTDEEKAAAGLPESHPGRFATHAWEPVCSLEEFMYSQADSTMDYEQFCNLTSASSVPGAVSRHLMNCNDLMFPPFEPDRHVWAFRTGVYHAERMEYYRFGERGVTTPPRLTACKYIDQPFPEEALFVRNPMNIATPSFQNILDAQNLGDGDRLAHKKISMWVYILIGRLFYYVNEKDRWQVLLFIKGLAGSGKSSILKFLRKFYNPVDIGVMSATQQENFGLSAYHDKYMFICHEMRNRFNVGQGDFQSIISGDDMLINRKYKTALSKEWNVPGIVAGNQNGGWADAQGSMVRRLVMLIFLKRIVNIDPNLLDKLEAELGLMLVKCNRLYRKAVEVWGDKDFWQIEELPEYFLRTKETLRGQINSLVAFLNDKAVVELSAKPKLADHTPDNPIGVYIPPERYTKLEVFKERYNAWMNTNNYKKVTFEPDHYASVFEEYGLTLVHQARPWNGRYDETTYVVGVGMVGGEQMDDPTYRLKELLQEDGDGDDGGDADAMGGLASSSSPFMDAVASSSSSSSSSSSLSPSPSSSSSLSLSSSLALSPPQSVLSRAGYSAARQGRPVAAASSASSSSSSPSSAPLPHPGQSPSRGSGSRSAGDAFAAAALSRMIDVASRASH